MQAGCLLPPEVGKTVWSWSAPVTFLLDYFSACFSAKLEKVRWGTGTSLSNPLLTSLSHDTLVVLMFVLDCSHSDF